MFCLKCGSRVADDAVFCLNCGNRITSEQPVTQQPVVQEPVMEQPMMQPAYEQPVMEQPIVEQPVMVSVQQPTVEPVQHQSVFEPVQQPTVEQSIYQPPVQEQTTSQDTVVLNPSMQPMSQSAYDQRQYVQQGTFQPAQPSYEQAMYQQPVATQGYQQNGYNPNGYNQTYNQGGYNPNGYNQTYNQTYGQSFYNTPAQTIKKEKTSVAAVLFLFIAAIASIAVCADKFMSSDAGMGVVNATYFVTAIILLFYTFSTKKSGAVLKSIFFVLALVMNVIFVGFAAFEGGLTIIKNAAAAIDYYYAVILMLQFVFLYIYFIISIIKGFTGKASASYGTCLLGYFAVLLTIATFVIDAVTGIAGIFAFDFIPIDLGIVCIVLGDVFATLRKAKNAEEKNK